MADSLCCTVETDTNNSKKLIKKSNLKKIEYRVSGDSDEN